MEFAPYIELLGADRTLVRPCVSDHRCKQQALRPFALTDDKGQPLCLTSEDIVAFAGVILSPVHLEAFVKQTSRAERGMPPVAGDFPFVVTSHPSAQPTVARDMAARLQADVAHFASMENASRAPQLLALLGEHVDAAAAVPQVAQLRAALASLRAQSQDFIHRALDYCELLTNSAADVSERELTAPQLRFLLGQLAHREPLLEFELLVRYAWVGGGGGSGLGGGCGVGGGLGVYDGCSSGALRSPRRPRRVSRPSSTYGSSFAWVRAKAKAWGTGRSKAGPSTVQVDSPARRASSHTHTY